MHSFEAVNPNSTTIGPMEVLELASDCARTLAGAIKSRRGGDAPEDDQALIVCGGFRAFSGGGASLSILLRL
jgi:hypothetical protein